MKSQNTIVLSKVIRTLVNPLRWGVIGRQIVWLAKTNWMLLTDAVERRRFSSNPNSRRYWDNKLRKYGDSWRDAHYHYILDLFPDDQEFSLLDLGSALGDGCELLKKTFPKAAITGVDISEVGIEKASAKSSDIRYMILDILTDPIPGEFDYITVVETLEHFDDPYDVLDKCLTHTRRSVIVCVPYKQNLSLALRWGKEHRSSFDETTFARYSSRVVRITEPLESTGNRYIVYEITPSR